jgi:cell wall-associated NlpC family hydrolase
VTTQATGSGRPLAIHRALRGTSRILLAGLLAVASLQAFATDPAAARDPLDRSPQLLSPVNDVTLGNPLSLPERTLIFARDIRTIFNAHQVPGEVRDTADAPKEGRIKGMLKRGLALLGTPYRWGGSSPESGFDCSGLVGYVFRNTLGIELPRISRDMANVGELIRDRDALIEGDLVFFSRKGSRVDHVGIYLGDGQFLHAPRTGKDVEVASLATGYWSKKFLQARRVATQ